MRKEGTERFQGHPPSAHDTLLIPSLLPKVPRATRALQIEEGRLSPWHLYFPTQGLTVDQELGPEAGDLFRTG